MTPTIEKIANLKAWYKAQLDGEIRLFKGEDNEMTTTNILLKFNHYDQLEKNLLSNGTLRHGHVMQIERAHYFNCEKWPLTRIKERALKRTVAQQEQAA